MTMKGKRQRKRGTWLILLGILMLAAAGVLTGWNLLQQSMAGEAARTALEALIPDIEERSGRDIDLQAQNRIGEGAYATADLPDYVLNPEMDMPVVKINGGSYIGVLSIPALDIELPVMENWNSANLQKAPCRYAGSVYLDNMVICAHNFDSHFGRIGDLSQGDSVDFVDADGNVFRYRVTETEILKPFDCDAMRISNWDLTLFTCTVGGATRVTVRCQLIR